MSAPVISMVVNKDVITTREDTHVHADQDTHWILTITKLAMVTNVKRYTRRYTVGWHVLVTQRTTLAISPVILGTSYAAQINARAVRMESGLVTRLRVKLFTVPHHRYLGMALFILLVIRHSDRNALWDANVVTSWQETVWSHAIRVVFGNLQTCPVKVSKLLFVIKFLFICSTALYEMNWKKIPVTKLTS